MSLLVRKLGLIFVILSFVFPLFVYAQEESITITTYYPAPYGVYNELRLFPHTPPSDCDSTKIGTMYYDSKSAGVPRL